MNMSWYIHKKIMQELYLLNFRESRLRNSGHSFNSSITWKTLPLPCKCTTTQVDQLDKVNVYINNTYQSVLFVVSVLQFEHLNRFCTLKHITSYLMHRWVCTCSLRCDRLKTLPTPREHRVQDFWCGSWWPT